MVTFMDLFKAKDHFSMAVSILKSLTQSLVCVDCGCTRSVDEANSGCLLSHGAPQLLLSRCDTHVRSLPHPIRQQHASQPYSYLAFTLSFGRVRENAKRGYELHVCLSVRMQKFGSHWTNVLEIWYLIIFSKIFGVNSSFIKIWQVRGKVIILKCMENYAQRKILFRDTKWLLSNMSYRGRDDQAVWACAVGRTTWPLHCQLAPWKSNEALFNFCGQRGWNIQKST